MGHWLLLRLLIAAVAERGADLFISGSEGISNNSGLGRGCLHILNSEHRFGIHEVSSDGFIDLRIVKESLLKSRAMLGRLRDVVSGNSPSNALISGTAILLLQLCHVVSVEIVTSIVVIKDTLCFEILGSLELLYTISDGE